MIHNLFSFHGTDHKVGTTMVSQSVAEALSAGHTNLKILFAAMNGRASTDYIREAPVGIDSLKFHMDNRMISGEDFIKTCTHKGNLYLLAGVANEMEAHYYYPDTAKYFLEEVSPEFDLVVADCGCDLDNGLALGAMSLSEEVFLISAQQETALRRYERNRDLFEELGIGISSLIVNKYDPQDPYGLPYITDRLEMDKDYVWKVEACGQARQAEIDGKTLLEYRNEAYYLDIAAVSNKILRKCGLAEIKRQRKSRWRSFI